jgi:hypothetical protein
MTPGQLKENRMSLSLANAANSPPSPIAPTAASVVEHSASSLSTTITDINSSVIRSTTPQNSNISAALKYFQEMRSEDTNTSNNLMLSRNRFFANMMIELQLNSSKNPSVIGSGVGSNSASTRSQRTDKAPSPRFDPEKMTPEQKITFNILLSYIEADYAEALKTLEQEYWFKKQQLYNMYDMNNDNNSG